MTRAERRRAEREARKQSKRNGGEMGDGGNIHVTVSPEGQSDGPCPNGHPDQFTAVVFEGAEPWPCERCGETPQFGPIETNL